MLKSKELFFQFFTFFLFILKLFIMNITVSLDYDQITFLNGSLNENDLGSLSLQYKYNCGTLSSSINLDDKLGDLINNTLTLNVSDIFPSKTIFDDGVYYFKITAGSRTSGAGPLPTPGTFTLTGCVYIGTTSRCKALAKYKETNNEIIKQLIHGLDHVNDCDNCDCTTMCTIYDYLTTLLDTNTTTTNVYSPCGCN